MGGIDFSSFKSALRGQVILPEDDGYDDARKIWNASVDKRPKVIARCAGVADVVDAVNFGRENSLLTAIRGGGHNVGGADRRIATPEAETAVARVSPRW